ncbi:hypothetical protein COO60DRAFT_1636155 [Scenedesmus sp. NREL 46B-D3]|nr:hypothetical protein COO60DRAFT_1636155 [Scenedesmus sp. NREL 46B-D3]
MQQRQQQPALLPASYAKLALSFVLQWTALAKAVSPPHGDALDHKELGQALHTIVALNAAVMQAWPAAAAAAGHNTSSSSSSSSPAEFAMYTLAAQRAETYTSETLVPIVAYANLTTLTEQPKALDLMLNDDLLLLLLLAHLALLSRQLAQQQQMPPLPPQQEAMHERLLQAVGLGGLLAPAAGSKAQHVMGAAACSADNLCDAVMALRAVFLLHAYKRSKLAGKFGELLAAHKPQRLPAARVELAAMWLPLLQVVLQLPLTEAAAGTSGEGAKRGCLQYTVPHAVDLARHVFDCLLSEVLERPAAAAHIALVWPHVSDTLRPSHWAPGPAGAATAEAVGTRGKTGRRRLCGHRRRSGGAGVTAAAQQRRRQQRRRQQRRMERWQRVAAAVARQPLGACFAALEAGLRFRSPIARTGVVRAGVRSHMFVAALCKELQRTRVLAACGALDLAWGTAAAGDDEDPPCISDSSWHGRRLQQCMAASLVMRARGLAHAGSTLATVARGDVPFTAELPSVVQHACWLTRSGDCPAAAAKKKKKKKQQQQQQQQQQQVVI